jgi:hypothetical protein
MNVRRVSRNCLVFGLALLLSACSGQPASGGPYVWIDVPTDGLWAPVDQTVRIEGHTSYSGGIARVEIWANGELHLVQENPPARGNLAHFDQSWMPPGAGEYIVEVKAVGTDGAESAPDVVHLIIGETVAEVTPTHTPVPEATSVVEPTPIITPTLAVTETPTPTATAAPTIPPVTRAPTSTPTPTPTPPPPEALIEFAASAAKIDAGECATLLWHVENVKAVFLDGTGVAGVGSKEVCPCKDTTYVLSVTLLDDTKTERSFTLRVEGACVTPTPPPTSTPEPDTTPPPVPSTVSPTGGAVLACDKVTLDWDGVSDPSGIAEYRVQVQQEGTAGNWDDVSGSPWNGLGGTDLERDLGCGGVYRWRVKAVDGAGNESAFSAWAEFGVNLP